MRLRHRTHFVKFKELVFNNNHLSITKRNDIHAGCPGKHSMLPDGRLDGIEACSSFSLPPTSLISTGESDGANGGAATDEISSPEKGRSETVRALVPKV